MSIKKLVAGAAAWLAARARKPSTYTGIATIALAIGKPKLARTVDAIGTVATSVTGNVPADEDRR